MSDDGSFLARWSRRKRNAGPDAREHLKPAKDESDVASETSVAFVPPGENKPFDPSTLPSIESIGAGSDIRPFLAPEVPADLTRAALRRVWLADPKIRDFIGLSENSWDFNAPGEMAGFGSIDKEEAARVLARLLGDADVTAVAENPLARPSQQGNAETSSLSEPQSVAKIHTVSNSIPSASQLGEQGSFGSIGAGGDLTQRLTAHDPSQSESTEFQQPRRHGSALPK